MSAYRSFLFVPLLLASSLSLFAAGDWRPVDPADLALKQSKTGADAEAIFREVRVLNESHGAGSPVNTVREYVRLKIFTARGKEFGDVQIPYFRDQTIFDVQGRTIHPDGSIVDLSKDSIFNKVIEKRGYKTKVVTFAMPAVEAGSIIEYRFSRNEGERSYRYRELEVQSAYPVREVNFLVKPLTSPYFSVPTMRFMPFGCVPERGQLTHDGYDTMTVKNVPAFYQEPYSPPNYSAKQWILIYYEENSNSGKDKYWTALGKDRYREYSEQVKVNGEMKTLAGEITSGAASDDAKLEKLFAYCRKEIKDTRGDEITTAELDKGKVNRTSIDTIHRKQGSAADITYAFLALAQAAGFNARRVDISDRATFLFGPAMQAAYFLTTFNVAVEVDGKWKFYDVSDHFLTAGALPWQQQGVFALIDDPKNPEMVQTPLIAAKDSLKNRFATLTLSEEGVLEGDVREMLFGNDAAVWREENLHTNQSEREEAVRSQLKRRFADFDLTNIKIFADADASKPVGVNYHITVRNYAQRTGKRLFVQPNFFAVGYLSYFPEATRHNNVYFEYPWSEVDGVDLTLPAGFVLDHADAPAGVNMPKTCSFSVKIGFDKAKNQIQYRRQFLFGDKDLLLFDVKNYPVLKQVFDMVHDADNHMLTLKNDPAAGAPSGPAQ